MRHYCLLALLIGLQLGPGVVAQSAAQSAPLRFASINLCTDQLLLELADREQIASVTFLSQQALSSFMANRAAGLHVNYGQAEELIAVKPDVVVTSSYDSPSALRFLNDLGFRVEVFALADSIGEVIANIRQMAILVGQEARGATLIDAMQRRLDFMQPENPGQNAPRGVIYEPNGYTGGPDTLRGDILRLSGWKNAAVDAGITGVGVMDLEALLLAAPERLIFSPYAPGTHSLGQRMLQHPAIRALTAQWPPLVVPSNLWICGGSMNMEAIAQLVQGRSAP